MSSQALRIIKEEIARAKENTPYARHALLEAIEQTILSRVRLECIEIDPKALLRDHMRKGGDPATYELPGEGLPEPERCLQRAGKEDEPVERCLLDPSHEGPCSSDPSRIATIVADCNDCRELTVHCHRHTPLGGCTWCHMAPAVGAFMVRELGDMRVSREDLCEPCRVTLETDPQIEIYLVNLFRDPTVGASERDFGSEKDDDVSPTGEES